MTYPDAGGGHSLTIGETGRYRTNVWDYAGISSLNANRMDDLAMHPTVKPVALVADASKDCSRRNEIVLDLLGGSGSTLIATETCGLQARLIEYDPAYCDTVATRCQSYTGKGAVLAGGNSAFLGCCGNTKRANRLRLGAEAIQC